MADRLEATQAVLGRSTWDKIHARLVAEADAAGEVEWNLALDCTINRAHQHATTRRRTEFVGRVAGARTGG